MRNYYEILEIETTASQTEIKAAYFRLCKQIKDDARDKKDFFAILAAYTLLSDDKKRATYDENLKLGKPECFYQEEEEVEEEEEPVEEFIAEQPVSAKSKLLQGLTVVVAGFIIFIFFFLMDDYPEEYQSRTKRMEGKNISYESNNDKSFEDEFNVRRTDEKSLLKPEDDNGAGVDNVQSATVADSMAIVRTVNNHISSDGVGAKTAGTFSGKQPVTKNAAPVGRLLKKDDAIVVVRNNSLDKPSKKLLNREELLSIVNSIVSGQQASNGSNCIRVVQSFKSNVTNPFAVVPHLQAKGFYIAGRGVSKQTSDGIKLEDNNSCLMLTIGIVDLQKDVVVNGIAQQEDKPSLAKAGPIKSEFQKRLTGSEMINIINSIIADSASHKNSATCIRVVQSSESNVSNGFDIIPLLQSKGFFISDRGYTIEAIDKIKVDYGNTCIAITIGRFEM